MDINQRKEVNEALQAINTTLGYLLAAKDYLNSARSWGIFDMVGGGFFSTLIKHNKMNDAKICLTKAKNSVLQLKKELSDVNEHLNVDVKIGDFLSFADFFFDGVITDWLVQSRISDARKQVDQAILQLETIKKSLLSIRID